MFLRRNQTGRNAAEICVETNNFHQVLQHFDDNGNIIDQRKTRLAIECQICMYKNLPLVNPHFGELAGDTHEMYIVLPHCGHAFGYLCMEQWIRTQPGYPSCPSCRTPLQCKRGHRSKLEVYGCASSDIKMQGKDIRDIRAMLLNKTCGRCCEQRENVEQPEGPWASLASSSQLTREWFVGNWEDELIEVVRSGSITAFRAMIMRFSEDELRMTMGRLSMERNGWRGASRRGGATDEAEETEFRDRALL